MIRRKTTKMPRSAVGRQHKVDICCTRRFVHAAPEGPMMLPCRRARPGIHDDDVFDADEGMKGIVGGEQPPAIAVMPVPSAKADAVGAINVDPI